MAKCPVFHMEKLILKAVLRHTGMEKQVLCKNYAIARLLSRVKFVGGQVKNLGKLLRSFYNQPISGSFEMHIYIN